MMRRFGLAGAAADHRRHPRTRASNVNCGRALQLGGGDWSSLFTEPVAIIIYVLMAILLLMPLVLS